MAPMIFALLLVGGTMTTPKDGPQAEAVALAKKTLSQALSVGVNQIQEEKIESMEWPDASLGCPQKGMMYGQMVTPGFRITLKVGEKIHRVHASAGHAVLCDQPTHSAPKPEEKNVGRVLKMNALARRDLASWLGVSEDQIKVNFIRPTTWPDTSLGCPEEGSSYAPGEIKGFIIELNHGDETFEYHSDAEKVIRCQKP